MRGRFKRFNRFEDWISNLRITFVSPVGEIGGAERVLMGLVAQLRLEHQIHVILMSHGPLQSKLEALGIEVSVLELPPIWQSFGERQTLFGSLQRLITAPFSCVRLWFYVRKLAKVLASKAPDIVLSNGVKAHLLCAAAKPKSVKLVWHIHDFIGGRRLSRKLLRAAAIRADLAVAVSKSVAWDFNAVIGRPTAVVVPNFTDTSHFAPDAVTRDLDSLAGLSEVPSGVVRVGLVATFALWKGHRLFLEAISRVVARLGRDAVRAYVVGGPIYRTTGGSQITAAELIEDRARLKLENVLGFVPFQEDPADAYRALDIVVHASTLPEPFGLTITEAMACGRAVVAANAGGPAEIITHESDGLLYELGNADALAEAITRLVENSELRNRLGKAARNTVLKRYQLSTTVDALLSAYRSLVGGRGSASL
jgi:glycosyltransferase involved in cell wall biosynthesis